jgi:glycosyltransferase involved in cell wall biosynthesis
MRVAVVLEQRFDRTPDGHVWANCGTYEFWQRYLNVFSEVTVVARLRDVQRPEPKATRASGPRVTFAEIPYYLGPMQYLRVALDVAKAAKRALSPTDAVILRLGSQIAIALGPHLWRSGRPYAVEVVGDPDDVFAPGVITHPLRPMLRVWFTTAQKWLCARACGAAYVTEFTLQRKYPCGGFSLGVSDVELDGIAGEEPGVLTTHYSSAALDPHAFRARDTESRPLRDGVRIVTVASLAQRYKGIDVLINAMARCVSLSPSPELSIIGDGHHRGALEDQVRRLGLENHVRFLGALPPGAAVRDELDRADVFVLPSRTEGLPRAMVEAMARGMPCIGSAVGGIPELLHPEDLVPSDDVCSLAQAIREVASNPDRRTRMSRRNFEKAKEFQEHVLRERRTQFYRHLERITRAWAAKNAVPQCVDL